MIQRDDHRQNSSVIVVEMNNTTEESTSDNDEADRNIVESVDDTTNIMSSEVVGNDLPNTVDDPNAPPGDSSNGGKDDAQNKLLATTKDWTSEDLDLRLNENAVLLSRWTLLLDRNGKNTLSISLNFR